MALDEKAIEAAALELDPRSRARLASRLLASLDALTTEEADAMRSPFNRSIVVLVLVAVAGVVAIWFGYRGLAATDDISIEVPFLVSGAFGGIGLVGFASGVVLVQFRRLSQARERAEIDRLIGAAEALLEEVR